MVGADRGLPKNVAQGLNFARAEHALPLRYFEAMNASFIAASSYIFGTLPSAAYTYKAAFKINPIVELNKLTSITKGTVITAPVAPGNNPPIFNPIKSGAQAIINKKKKIELDVKFNSRDCPHVCLNNCIERFIAPHGE